jgi:hypothetical protein
MQEDLGLTPGERELEDALQSLRPAHLDGSRDRVMFRAGYARARRQGRIWQAASACLGAVLLLSIVWQTGSGRAGRSAGLTVAYDRPAVPATERAIEGPEASAGARPAMDGVQLRGALLERGRDALSPWRPIPCGLRQGGLDHRPLEDLVSSM